MTSVLSTPGSYAKILVIMDIYWYFIQEQVFVMVSMAKNISMLCMDAFQDVALQNTGSCFSLKIIVMCIYFGRVLLESFTIEVEPHM